MLELSKRDAGGGKAFVKKWSKMAEGKQITSLWSMSEWSKKDA
jgi:hypothetical protein